jgi:hypothetical protein
MTRYTAPDSVSDEPSPWARRRRRRQRWVAGMVFAAMVVPIVGSVFIR